MARNVGSIEVTVNADTGKLAAQIKAAAERDGKEYADTFEDEASDISGTELLNRLREILARAKAQLEGALEANVSLNFESIQDDIDRAQAALDAADLNADIDAEIDKAQLKAQMVAAQEAIGDLLLHLDTEFDAGEITGDVKEIDALLGSIGVELVPVAQQKEFDTRLKEVDSLLDAIGVHLEPLAVQAEFDARLAEVDALLQDIDVTVEPDIDKVAFKDRLDAVDALLQDIGVTLQPEADQATFDDRVADVDSLLHSIGVEMLPEADQPTFQARIDSLDDLLTSIGVELKPEAKQATFQDRIDDIDALLKSIGVEMLPEADQATFQARVDDLDALLFSIGVEMKPEAKEKSFEARVKEIDALLLSVGVTMQPDLTSVSIGRFNAAVKEIDALMVSAGVPLTPEINKATWAARLALLSASVGNINVGVNPQTIAASAHIKAWKLAMGANNINVGINPQVNTASTAWATARQQIIAWATSSGQGAGAGFGKGLSSTFADQGKLIFTLVAGFGDSIAVLVQGAIGGIAAIASSAAFAIGGAAGFALVAIGGLSFAAGATLVGLQGFGGALKVINDEFKEAHDNRYDTEIGAALGNLGGNAATAALAFKDVRDRLHESRKAIQDSLFKGLGQVIHDLADNALPAMTAAMQIAADDVNTFAKRIAKIAENTDWIGLMEGLDPTLQNMFTSAGNVVGVLEPFFETAAPAAERISQALADSTGEFEAWANSKGGIKTLTDFFNEGAQSLLLWFGLIGSIGGLLGTIFGSGKTPGDAFLTHMDETITKWDEFLEGEEGQGKLEDFFGATSQMFRDMEPAFQGLKDAWTTLTDNDASSNFRSSMEGLGKILPVVAEALAAMGDLHLIEALGKVLETFQPLLGLFDSLPDPLKEAIGLTIVWTKVLKGLSGVMLGLGKNPWMLAIAAAFAVVTTGIALFTGGNEEAEQRTHELTGALRDQSDQVMLNADGYDSMTAGIDAYNAALVSGEEGEKFQNSLATVGRTADDARQTLLDMGRDSFGTLRQMATDFGATGDGAIFLANAVNETNDNFGDTMGDLRDVTAGHRELLDIIGVEALDWDNLTAATGLSRDQLERLLPAMENIQDQVDDDKDRLFTMAQAQLQYAAGANASTVATLAQAASNLGLTGTLDEIIAKTENAIPLYDEYLRVQVEIAQGTSMTQEAHDAMIASMTDGRIAFAEANAASEERAAALREQQQEAWRAHLAEENLIRTTRKIASEVGEVKLGIPREVITGFGDLGDKIDAARQAAENFSDVFDKLFGGRASWDEAIINMESAGDAARDMVDGVTGAMDENSTQVEEFDQRVLDASGNIVDMNDHLATSFNLSTTAGQEAAGGMITWARATVDAAAAGIEQGRSLEEVEGHMARVRGEMEDNLVQMGFSQQGAEDYVNTLLGTPESLETIIENPGLLDALLNLEDLTVLYDAAGNPVVTEFEALGLDPALASSQEFIDLLNEVTGGHYEVQVAMRLPATELDGFKLEAQEIANTTYTPIVSSREIVPATEAAVAAGDALTDTENGGQPYAPTVDLAGTATVVGQIEDVQEGLDTTDQTTAEPTIDIPSQILMMVLLAAVATELQFINDFVSEPQITLPTYQTVTTQLLALMLGLTVLNAKTAKPHIDMDKSYDTVKKQIDTLQTEMNGLAGMVATPDVRLDGYQTVMQQIDNIQINMSQLHDRTITLTTNNVSTGGGNMAGGLIGHEQLARVGERGLAEAIIPLQLPLNRVNPEVREMAALLRGERPAASSAPGRSSSPINQYFTLTSADPAAVAVQTMNRAAAMAG